ncbi:hypothetical protein ACRAWD_29770 [Caulobacter segnis]
MLMLGSPCAGRPTDRPGLAAEPPGQLAVVHPGDRTLFYAHRLVALTAWSSRAWGPGLRADTAAVSRWPTGANEGDRRGPEAWPAPAGS